MTEASFYCRQQNWSTCDKLYCFTFISVCLYFGLQEGHEEIENPGCDLVTACILAVNLLSCRGYEWPERQANVSAAVQGE